MSEARGDEVLVPAGGLGADRLRVSAGLTEAAVSRREQQLSVAAAL